MPTVADDRHADGAVGADLLARFSRDVLLANGRTVRVRAATPADLDDICAFYDGLSDTSSYYRFFGIRPALPMPRLERAVHEDLHQQVMLLAETGGAVIGVGEYWAVPSPDAVEVAFAVADEHQHEGIATLMLEDLARIAHAAGYRRLVAETLPGNESMKEVFRYVGLATRAWFEHGTVHVELDLTDERLLADAADARDWQATVRSLRPVLDPAHVVVIGAGRSPRSPGRRVLDNLMATFTGRISVVHPEAGDIAGLRPVRRLGELDPPPDLAIVATPAAKVAEIIEECGLAGVPAAVVVSPGSAEAGPAGAGLERSVLRAARRHGMRIVGPSSLGVSSARFDATCLSHRLARGGIAIASQSRRVGLALGAEAGARGVGVSSFVSMGSKVDISGSDLLRAWADDPATSVVVLGLESLGDRARFVRVARAVNRRKPVVALIAGRPRSGDDASVGGLLTAAGLVRAGDVEQAIDLGVFFDRQPTPRGRRVALIADALDRLRSVADVAATLGLTVELSAAVPPERIVAAVAAVDASGEVDGCVLCVADLDRYVEAVDALHLDVPIVACTAGSTTNPGRVPAFPCAERALQALALASGRGEWLATGCAEPLEPSMPDVAPLRAMPDPVPLRA